MAPSNKHDVNTMNETMATVKTSLTDLEKIFDSLQKQAAGAVQGPEGETERVQLLNKVRTEIDASDQTLDTEIAEIKVLLDNALNKEIVDHLQSLIEAGVKSQIDEIVKEEVASELAKLRPQALQDEVKKHRKELEQLQKELHNSESRRINARLRTSEITGDLHTLYTPDGIISKAYPPTLQDLVHLDGDTAKQLLAEYKVDGISDSREEAVNKFMQFCGVVYQLIPPSAGGSARTGVTLCEVLGD